MVAKTYCVHELTKNCFQSIYMLIAVMLSNKNTHCHIISWHITGHFNCIPCLNLNRLSKFQRYDRFFLLLTLFSLDILSINKKCRESLFFQITMNVTLFSCNYWYWNIHNLRCNHLRYVLMFNKENIYRIILPYKWVSNLFTCSTWTVNLNKGDLCVYCGLHVWRWLWL